MSGDRLQNEENIKSIFMVDIETKTDNFLH